MATTTWQPPTDQTRDGPTALVHGRYGQHPFRTTARVVGALFLAGMVVGVVGNGTIQSILDAPDHLAIVTANSLLLAVCAMLLLLASVGDAAHGILMLPVLKQHGERIAFGYLGYRLVDAVFIALWALFLLLQIPLGREYLTAAASDTAYLQTLSTLSIQASLYAYHISQITLGIAGVLLCSVFYRARLVPRPVAAWGLIGYATILGGSVLEALGFDLHLLHTLPGGLWELFIGVWLIARGFSTPSIAAGDERQ
jgi:hypothetical protein